MEIKNKNSEIKDSFDNRFLAFQEILDSTRITAPAPSEQLHENFFKMLEQEKLKRAFNLFIWKPLFFAVSVVLLVFGGLYVIEIKKNKSYNSKILAITAQQQEYKKEIIFGLSNNKIASNRLKSIAYIDEYNSKEAEIIQLLVNYIKYDENINIKIAAIESLSKYSKSEDVLEQLIEILKKSTNSEIQVALIKALGSFKDQRAIEPMKMLLAMQSVEPFVKQILRKQLFNFSQS